MQVFDERFQAESEWNGWVPSWLCLEAVIRNLHETYRCRMYSRKLLMMVREDARNKIGIISAPGWLFQKKSITMHGNMSVNYSCFRAFFSFFFFWIRFCPTWIKVFWKRTILTHIYLVSLFLILVSQRCYVLYENYVTLNYPFFCLFLYCAH